MEDGCLRDINVFKRFAKDPKQNTNYFQKRRNFSCAAFKHESLFYGEPPISDARPTILTCQRQVFGHLKEYFQGFCLHFFPLAQIVFFF